MAETNSTEDDEEAHFNEHSRYHLEQEILKTLALQGKHVLQRDIVIKAYAPRDKEAKRAVVYNVMISNTVLQVLQSLTLIFSVMDTVVGHL